VRPAHLPAVEQPEPREAGLVAEVDVLGEREVRDEFQLLADDAQTLVERVADRGQPHRLTVEAEFARIGLEVAVEDADQRRLAGAVVADEAEDLARVDRDRDAAQRLDPAEALADAVGRDGGNDSGITTVLWWRVVQGAAPEARPRAYFV
jgi:hypothetical protein